MPKWLEAIFPQLTLAKLIACAVAAAALIALVLFCVFTVKGWRDDAAKLPVVQAQLDQSQAAYAALDKGMTGKLTDILTKLRAIDQRYQGEDAQITGAMASIDAFITTFKRDTDNAFPVSDACRERDALRQRLLHLLDRPDGTEFGLAGGSVGGGSAAGPSDPARTSVAVPGGERGVADPGQVGAPGVVVPAPAGGAGIDAERAAAGPGGDAERRAVEGSGPAVPASGLGFWERLRARVRAAVKLMATAMVETAQDDKGNA